MRPPGAVRSLAAAALGLAVCGAACGAARAQTATLPEYSPAPLQAGVIRSWGDKEMRGTMSAWEQAFRKHHPEISFQDTLLGSATGMAGIITNTSDLSLMGRPVSVNEVIGFEWVHRVKPLGLRVMNGSLKAEGKSPALAVLVSRANPVQQISMAQLAAILGCPADARQPVTWAMAGATGAWSRRPIHAYVYDDQTGTGAFLQQAVQGAKDCWNWEIVREFKDRTLHGRLTPAARQIAEALRRDPEGLGVATLSEVGPQIKALPVAGAAPAVTLAPENIISNAYPLARGVYIYIYRAADKPVDPKVSEFLRFVLSREGQEAVQRQGDYLPLDATAALAERKKLE